MSLECPNCGMQITSTTERSCPKCEAALRQSYSQGLLEVDVAHRGENWEAAEHRIMQACNQALFAQHKGLKVIHGYGSGRGHTSIIRRHTIPLLHRLSRQYGGKVVPDNRNPGAHILYFD